MSGGNVTINDLASQASVASGDSFPAWSALGAFTYQAFPSQMIAAATASQITMASGGKISSAGNFTLGSGSAMGTTATVGYVMITSCAGPPTGVPVGFGVGNMPIQYDTTNNKLWVYAASGAWRGVVLT